MSDLDAVRMDEDERDEFLGRAGTGVLSLSTADGDPPHSVPVSYGYDPVEAVFYFRVAVGEGSGKAERVEELAALAEGHRHYLVEVCAGRGLRLSASGR